MNALDAPARAQVETHLQNCAQCRVIVASLHSAAAQLPLALGNASPLRPPPSLRENILQAAQAEWNASAHTQAPHSALDANTIPPAQTTPRARWLRGPRVWRFAFTAVVILIAAVFGWSLTNNPNEQRAQKQVDDIKTQQALAVPVLHSMTSQEIVLASPDKTLPAFGKVVLDPNKPTVVFIGYKLPQLPAGYEYVLWTIDRGMMQARGSFTPNRDGFAMVVFSADRNDPQLKQVVVTRQRNTEIVPSAERVLVWRADPNDLAQDFSFDSLFPAPTLTYVKR